MDHRSLLNDDHQFRDLERNFSAVTRTSIDEDINLTVETRNLDYFVGSKQDKQILHNVNTTFVPGELHALMGPSGAGKTTLISAILGNCGGKVRGEVLINGAPAEISSLKSVSKLIPQIDVLTPSFLVSETMYYTGELVLPTSMSRREKDIRIQRVLEQLSLQECVDVKVGDVDSKGISGGQRKRLSIGMDLLSNPALLVLDEPTSGLDAKTAEDVVQIAQDLATGKNTGTERTVISTIHQPSYRMFTMFHKVTFLVKGRVAFSGSFADCEEHFSSLGYPIPKNENPADHYIRVLQDSEAEKKIVKEYSRLTDQISISSSTVDSEPSDTETTYSWWNKLCGLCCKKDMTGSEVSDEEYMAMATMQKRRELLRQAPKYPISQARQFWVLFKRNNYETIKDPNKFLRGLCLKLIVGALIGIVWWGKGDPPQIQNLFPILGALFVLVLNSIVDTIAQTIILFPATRSLMRREYKNGQYSLPAFYYSLMLSKCLFALVYVSFMAFPIYFMVELQSEFVKVMNFLVILVLLTCIGNALGVIVGSTSETLIDAQNSLAPLLAPLILFSGYVLDYDSIPKYFQPFYHISFVQYGLSALQINQLTGLTFHEKIGLIDFPISGETILKDFRNLDPATHKVKDYILILAGYTVAIIMIGYYVIRRDLRKKTN